MTLKIELRPFEGLTIGNLCYLTNGESRSVFALEGNALVLRDAHILKPEDVHDDVTRLYFLIQEIGLNRLEPTELVNVLLYESSASSSFPPTSLPELASYLSNRRYYSALALMRKLM